MLDPQTGIFCNTSRRTSAGMVREGLSHRYTMMTLLGLRRYEGTGSRSPVETAPVLERLLGETSWVNCAGDLGLLLWTVAELAPERLAKVYQSVRANQALNRFSDARHGYTMEVSFYLTGLARCCLAGYGDLSGLTEQIEVARRILERNAGPSGVYGHLSSSGCWAGRLRGRIGTFADQVYPTIAFSVLAQARNDEKAKLAARRTAERICQLQGPYGEWCWHYDSHSGRVVSRYPVYSVHQHAMAPMMLFAAAEATGQDFSQAIYRGLEWISGNNELQRDFVEPSLGLVWRCIYLDREGAWTDAALRFSGIRSDSANPNRLKTRYECRPYELGWLLYAFAGRGEARSTARSVSDGKLELV
jgi:hypothetical protein